MNNSSLKAKIELKANVKVASCSYKCCTLYEGYAAAYPAGTEQYRSGRKARYKGKPLFEARCYAERTNAQATRLALLRLADRLEIELGVKIGVTDADASATRRENDADFAVRTRTV